MRKIALAVIVLIIVAVAVSHGMTMKDWCWNYIEGEKACVVVSPDSCVELSFSSCEVGPYPFGSVDVSLTETTVEQCYYTCDYRFLEIDCPQWSVRVVCFPNIEYPVYMNCVTIQSDPFLIYKKAESESDNQTETENNTQG